MTGSIDPHAAALSLSDVDAMSRRVRQSLIYRGSSLIMMLWGALVACGYTINMIWPWHAAIAWNLIYAVGTPLTIAIVALQRKTQNKARGGRAFEMRLSLAYLLFFGFGILWSAGLSHFTPRQLGAFWATYFMLGYVLVGLWIAPAFVVIGVSISALTLIGYLYAGPWFDIWMAVVNGGGLILAGFWMRRD